MKRIKHAVVRQERIGLEIYLRSIVTQTSGEVEIALAIRDPQLCDKLTGPVLGLYTNRKIRCRIQGRGDKRLYIK